MLVGTSVTETSLSWLDRQMHVMSHMLLNLVGRRFPHQHFADSRESIRRKKRNLFLKYLARFARIASSLRFAFKFA